MFRIKRMLIGIALAILCGGGAVLAMITSGYFPEMENRVSYGIGGMIGFAFLLLWITVFMRRAVNGFHSKRLASVDELTPLTNQTRRDIWVTVRNLVYGWLKQSGGKFSLKTVNQEYRLVNWVCDKGAREIREALNELSTIRPDDPVPNAEQIHAAQSMDRA